MTKPLRTQILEYLKEQDAVDIKIDIVAPFLLEDDSREQRSSVVRALTYLENEGLIALNGRPHDLTSTMAGQFPSKYITGIKASITRLGEKELIPLVIPPPITQTHYNVNNSIGTTIGDYAQSSLTAHDINIPNSNITPATTIHPAIKWIFSIVGAIIAGLIIWYITNYMVYN